MTFALLLMLLVVVVVDPSQAFSVSGCNTQLRTGGTATPPSPLSSALIMAAVHPQRENEIRRKILQLKRQGRIKHKDPTTNADDDESSSKSSSSSAAASSKSTTDYTEKIKAKLGRKKAAMMGLTSYDKDVDDEDDDLDDEDSDDEYEFEGEGNDESSSKRRPIINPTLFDYDDEVEEPSDEDLVELVAQKLKEKRRQEQQEREEAKRRNSSNEESSPLPSSSTTTQTTSGVGGTWNKPNTTQADVETYQPKTGSWGAFPRPKDISKAYGGGRRVGAGIDETSLLRSQENTRERLRQYREKVGIEVQAEKDHANEIEEALRIAGYAMQVSTK